MWQLQTLLIEKKSKNLKKKMERNVFSILRLISVICSLCEILLLFSQFSFASLTHVVHGHTHSQEIGTHMSEFFSFPYIFIQNFLSFSIRIYLMQYCDFDQCIPCLFPTELLFYCSFFFFFLNNSVLSKLEYIFFAIFEKANFS